VGGVGVVPSEAGEGTRREGSSFVGQHRKEENGPGPRRTMQL
jgi:hypothetical protein